MKWVAWYNYLPFIFVTWMQHFGSEAFQLVGCHILIKRAKLVVLWWMFFIKVVMSLRDIICIINFKARRILVTISYLATSETCNIIFIDKYYSLVNKYFECQQLMIIACFILGIELCIQRIQFIWSFTHIVPVRKVCKWRPTTVSFLLIPLWMLANQTITNSETVPH